MLAFVEIGKSDGVPSASKVCSPLPCQFHDEMGFLSVLYDTNLCMCTVAFEY